MKDTQLKELDGSIAKYIKSSQKKCTILFTDIVDSTRFWDKHGDIKGRLMVNTHNRALFPVIKKFKGKVIKTIGDSIMAFFSKPEKAVDAAIAIQQMLQNMREQDPNFGIRVRIGVHTGTAIVESGDVYGDVVNVASRIESHAEGDEITVSKDTINAVKKRRFNLSKPAQFLPKGKKEYQVYYRCLWQKEKSLVKNIKVKSFLPLTRRQKIEVSIYTLTTIFTLVYFYWTTFRYFIIDSEKLALSEFNPQKLINVPPYVFGIVIGLTVIALVIIIKRTRIPTIVLRFTRGVFGFCIGYFILFGPLYFAHEYIPRMSEIKYESKHLFVEVLESEHHVRAEPRLNAKKLLMPGMGDLLLLTDVKKVKNITWNKVVIGPGTHGWIPRILPPKIGVPAIRVTKTDKFYIKMYELVAMGFGGLFFLWGFLFFRIKPV